LYLVITIASLWLLDVIKFHKGQHLRIAEKFWTQEFFVQKFNSIYIFPDEATQTVLLLVREPLKHQVKLGPSEASIFSSKYRIRSDKDVNQPEKTKKSPRDLLVTKEKSLSKLKNCSVLNQQNWLCTETLEVFNKPVNLFGKIDGDWIVSSDQKNTEFHGFEIYSSKIRWWSHRRKCGSFCYQASIFAPRFRKKD